MNDKCTALKRPQNEEIKKSFLFSKIRQHLKKNERNTINKFKTHQNQAQENRAHTNYQMKRRVKIIQNSRRIFTVITAKRKINCDVIILCRQVARVLSIIFGSVVLCI